MSNPGEIRLDPTWPGLDLRADEVEVDPETLDRVALWVRSDHYAHQDGYTTGTLSFLRSAGMREGEHWFGFWPTGEYMELGLEQARRAIEYYYTVLDQQIAAAADLFATTAEEYREVEQGLRSNLEATSAEGWDRLAASVAGGGPMGPAAGEFQGTTPVPGITAPEDTSNYNADWILERIAEIKDREAWKALGFRGDTYHQVADRLQDIAANLKSQAQTLAQEWNSETAVAAQRALQLIAGTATHLSEASRGVANFLHDSSAALASAVNDFPEDSGVAWYHDVDDAFGANHLGAKHNEIRQKLASLNQSYTYINDLKLPKQISAQLPQLTEIPPQPPYQDAWGGGGGAGFGGGSGFVPSSPPRVPSLTGGEVGTSGSVPDRVSGVAQVPGGQFGAPGGAGVGGIDAPSGTGGLAGVGPGGGVVPGGIGGPGGGVVPGGGPGGAGMVPGGGAGMVGPGGVGMVPGGAGAAGRTAGGGGAGRLGGGAGGVGRGGGVVGGVPIGGAGGAGAGGRGSGGGRGAGGRPGGPVGGAGGPAGGAGGVAGGRGGIAGGMMPMGGAAGRGAEERHARPDSWLVEDDDPWQPDDDVPPGVIR